MAILGESDHNLVFVRPKYLTIALRFKPKQYLLKTGLLRPLTGYKVLLNAV